MPKRTIHHIDTGGTVGSAINSDGARDADTESQRKNLDLLRRVPFTEYNQVDVTMRGDSSLHRRSLLTALAEQALQVANQGHGMVITHGTDTMNLTTATLALAGNEVWKYPVVLIGSIKGPEKPNSDAPYNIITGGFFASYGDASGVFAVRPNGVVITSRHDTPGGAIDWHSRGIPQAEGSFFAKINLEALLDVSEGEFRIKFELKRKKGRNVVGELERLIGYQRKVEDGTLDYADIIVVGGRGRLPNVNIHGFGKTDLTAFKTRPQEDSLQKIKRDMFDLIAKKRELGKVVGRVIPHLALIEHIRRHKKRGDWDTSSDTLNQHWAKIMSDYLTNDLNIQWHAANTIVSFWEKWSDTPNTDMDFNGIVSFDVSSDPRVLYDAFGKSVPRGVVLRATGASGMRLNMGENSYEEGYDDLLNLLKKEGVPVVLVSSSRGEVTSFEYPPALYLLNNDLLFFGGTMDPDLVEPRLALMNCASNCALERGLVEALDVPSSVKSEIIRNIQRQLLSGSHYRNSADGEVPDRKKIEDLYGIETRAL